MPCPWLQFTHSPCRSYSDSGGGGTRERERGCLPCCGAACFPACLPQPQPQTRDTERGRHRGREHCIFLSIPPSPPSFCASFPLLPSRFYISCLRLPSKGQRALRSVCTCICVCSKQAASGWCIRQWLLLDMCISRPMLQLQS